MNLIEKLGLEKCKQIVERHHSLGAHFSKFIYFSEKHDDFFTVKWVSRIGDFINIEDLRTAIADHERTDHCTNIRNHISPNTKVVEHEQKPKQEVKHGFYDSNCW